MSTALDYSKFLQMILNKGVYNNIRILSRKSVELMLTNHTGDLNLNEINYPNRQVFGLGFALRQSLDKSPSFGSEGELGWGGAYSVYWADPTEELAVVFYTAHPRQ